MKKIIGFVVVLLLIPFFIFIIKDIDRIPEYPNIEFQVLDKPLDKQMYLDNNFYYELPNTITEIYEELPEYIVYYGNDTINLDDGNLNYTIDNDIAYLNYIDGNISLVSKPTQIVSKSNNLANPDIENKEYLGDGVYRLYQYRGLTIDYDVFSGVFNYNGTTTDSISAILFNVEQNTEYTISYYPIYVGTTPGSFILDVYSPFLRVLNQSNKDEDLINTFTTTTQATVNTSLSAGRTYNNYKFKLQLEKGDTATPYYPPGEHTYPLGDGVELPKLPNGIGDKWLQNGTIERNVGKIINVDYAEYGTLEENTYTNLLTFISNNSNEDIKIFLNDTIIKVRYKTTVLDDKIIISNDNEFITIYSNDTYTSTQILEEETTYKLEGYHVISYIDGKFNNIILTFFWLIPLLLVGGLFYLLFNKKGD